MQNYADLRTRIEGFLQTDLTGVDLVFENTEENNLYDSHVSVEIDDTNSEPVDMSGLVFKVEGTVSFVIRTQQGIGSKEARNIASQIITSMQSLCETIELVVKGPILKSVGKVDDTTLYEHQLIVDFSYFYGQSE